MPTLKRGLNPKILLFMNATRYNIKLQAKWGIVIIAWILDKKKKQRELYPTLERKEVLLYFIKWETPNQ